LTDIYEEFSAELVARVREKGLPSGTVLVEIAVQTLQDRFGGERVFLPKISKKQAILRDQHIREEYTGTNLNELMSKYECSKSTVYRAISPKKRRKRRG